MTYTGVYTLLAFTGLACVLFIALCSNACWRFAKPVVRAFLSTLGKFVDCVLASIWTNVESILTALTHLPISWYIMSALTVPGACNLIAQPLAVVYLAAYCATGLYICASVPKKAPPLLPLAAKTVAVGAKAHFLSELRIARASQN
jgi:hypothetical protein